jgi:hypothetical protein
MCGDLVAAVLGHVGNGRPQATNPVAMLVATIDSCPQVT